MTPIIGLGDVLIALHPNSSHAHAASGTCHAHIQSHAVCCIGGRLWGRWWVEENCDGSDGVVERGGVPCSDGCAMSVETGAHEPARDACRDAVSGVWPIHVRLSAHRMRPSNTTAPSCAKHYWSLGSDHVSAFETWGPSARSLRGLSKFLSSPTLPRQAAGSRDAATPIIIRTWLSAATAAASQYVAHPRNTCSAQIRATVPLRPFITACVLAACTPLLLITLFIRAAGRDHGGYACGRANQPRECRCAAEVLRWSGRGRSRHEGLRHQVFAGATRRGAQDRARGVLRLCGRYRRESGGDRA